MRSVSYNSGSSTQRSYENLRCVVHLYIFAVNVVAFQVCRSIFAMSSEIENDTSVVDTLNERSSPSVH